MRNTITSTETVKDSVTRILGEIGENKDNVKEMFIVLMSYDGRPTTYSLGNWHTLALAAALLQNEFNIHASGDMHG